MSTGRGSSPSTPKSSGEHGRAYFPRRRPQRRRGAFPHPRERPVAFALTAAFIVAVIYLPDLYLHLDERGYFTFGLPGSLPQASGQPLPSVYASRSSSSLHTRSRDTAPLRLGEVFRGRAREPSHGGVSFTLRGARLDADCAGTVWGERLRAELSAGGCSQVVRGLYGDSRSETIGFVAIFNMRDNEAAERVVSALDPESGAGFVLPLRGEGPLARLGQGYGRSNGEAQGHFVFLRWAQRFDGPRPQSIGSEPDALRDAAAALSTADWALRDRRLADP